MVVGKQKRWNQYPVWHKGDTDRRMLRYNGSSQFMIKIFSDSVLGSSVACSRNGPSRNYCSLELIFSQGILYAYFIGLPQILFPQIIVFSRDIIIFLYVVRTLSLFSIILNTAKQTYQSFSSLNKNKSPQRIKQIFCRVLDQSCLGRLSLSMETGISNQRIKLEKSQVS